MKFLKLISTLVFSVLLLNLVGANNGKAKGQTVGVDTKTSKVNWLAKKVGGQHSGSIGIKSGSLIVNSGKLTAGEFVIDMTTIKCSDITNPKDNKEFVEHISTGDFFEVDKFPTASLKITKVGVNSMTGNLTIKGITKEVTFPTKTVIKGSKVFANATIAIDRTDFDVKYGSKKFFDSIGDKAIDDLFTLTVKLKSL